MKQHITIEQLRELNLESRNRLLINADAWNEYKLEHGAFSEHEMCSQISIGKMIEILEQHGEYPNIYISNNPGVKTWEVQSVPYTDAFEKEELCDALFEAIKTIL